MEVGCLWLGVHAGWLSTHRAEGVSLIEEAIRTLWYTGLSMNLESGKAQSLESIHLSTACESRRQDASRPTSFSPSKVGSCNLVVPRTPWGSLEVQRWDVCVRTAGPNSVPQGGLD